MTYQSIVAGVSCVELDDELIQPQPHWTIRIFPEILSDIFTWCIEAHEKPPLNVSQVCRRWRCVALHTPQLWRRLPFRERFADVDEERRFITFLSEVYLPRSGGIPITFSWHPWHELAGNLFQVLLQHSERWGNVHFVMHEQMQSQIAGLQDHLHSLYALKVTLINDSGSVSLQPFKAAPKLRYFALDDRRIDVDAPIPSHGWPWNQVTHTSISLYTTHHFDYHSLSSFSNLIYLRLHWPRWTLIPEAVARQHLRKAITFTSCRYLQLDFSLPLGVTHNAPFPNPLQNMYFPNLEYLFIYYDAVSFTDPFTLSELESFIGRLKTCNTVTPLKSFHWFRHCNYFAAPTAASHVSNPQPQQTVFRLLPKTLSNLRVTLFPRFLLEKLFNVLTTEATTFLPGLRKLDLGVNVSVLSSAKEFGWFCEKVERVVGCGCERRLDEIRIQLIKVVPVPLWVISPWRIVFRVDGWEERFREDVGGHLEDSLEGLDEEEENKEDKDKEEDVLNDARPEPITVTNLRRALFEFMRSDDLLSRHARLRTSPRFRIATIKRWLKMLKMDTASRRWTAVGHDSIMYVSPHSPLRNTESWVFGVEDDYLSDVEEVRYIDNDRVPGVPRAWLDARDLTKYANVAVSG